MKREEDEEKSGRNKEMERDRVEMEIRSCRERRNSEVEEWERKREGG